MRGCSHDTPHIHNHSRANGHVSDNDLDLERGGEVKKAEIEFLRMLGFVDTVEDGAILQGGDHVPIDFIWKGETFEFAMKRYKEAVDALHENWQAVGSSVGKTNLVIRKNRI